MLSGVYRGGAVAFSIMVHEVCTDFICPEAGQLVSGVTDVSLFLSPFDVLTLTIRKINI